MPISTLRTAMILAAGKGERMRPLTDHTPKPLLEVGGKPLICHHIERLARAGVTHIVINLFWLAEQIPARLGTGEDFGVQIDYITETELLETAGGIANALPLLTQHAEAPFWVVNGDVWTDVDFVAANQKVQQILSEHDMAALMMVDNPLHHPKGDFLLVNHRLKDIQFEEEEIKSATKNNTKAKTHAVQSQLTYSGVGVYRPAMFRELPIQPMPLRPLLNQLIQQNQLAAWHHTGQWHDIGTPQRLAQLNKELSI